MGPGIEKEKSHGADPPLCCSERDLYAWRKNVAQWVDLISSAAEKDEDKFYKTIRETLARQLYNNGPPQVQKSIVDQAQEKKFIDYKQDDQVQAVKDIVDPVATDPPISIMTRLIDSFHKVTSRRKKKGDALSTFVSRFLGLAAEHLMHAEMNVSSQIGEVLAIILLKNAALSNGTLTNVKLQLISLAESRKDIQSSHDSSRTSLSSKLSQSSANPLEDAKNMMESTKAHLGVDNEMEDE